MAAGIGFFVEVAVTEIGLSASNESDEHANINSPAATKIYILRLIMGFTFHL
ncbi:MAG: hypothetical protein IPN96_07150 [Anaerolineales bacterium]|nr:hypothetical protein [Anaerolineales bacterium]